MTRVIIYSYTCAKFDQNQSTGYFCADGWNITKSIILIFIYLEVRPLERSWCMVAGLKDVSSSKGVTWK